MDRALWEKHLALADEHVAQAEHIVAGQKRVLAELTRDRHPTAMAASTLAVYEDLLALHIQDRDRIKRDLEADPGRGLRGT